MNGKQLILTACGLAVGAASAAAAAASAAGAGAVSGLALLDLVRLAVALIQ